MHEHRQFNKGSLDWSVVWCRQMGGYFQNTPNLRFHQVSSWSCCRIMWTKSRFFYGPRVANGCLLRRQ